MTQLCFPFAAADDPPAAVSRYRKRLRRVAAQAFELGRRRAVAGAKRRIAPHSLGAAAAPMPVRPAYVDRADRNELHELAARIARLSISRRDPEAWHIEKSEISAALRAIARRS